MAPASGFIDHSGSPKNSGGQTWDKVDLYNYPVRKQRLGVDELLKLHGRMGEFNPHWTSRTFRQHKIKGTSAYLTNVLQMLDIMAFSTHDFIYDIGSHLISVLKGSAETEAVSSIWIQMSILNFTSPFLHAIFLVNPQL